MGVVCPENAVFVLLLILTCLSKHGTFGEPDGDTDPQRCFIRLPHYMVWALPCP